MDPRKKVAFGTSTAYIAFCKAILQIARFPIGLHLGLCHRRCGYCPNKGIGHVMAKCSIWEESNPFRGGLPVDGPERVGRPQGRRRQGDHAPKASAGPRRSRGDVLGNNFGGGDRAKSAGEGTGLR
jgi:hypothetical protein